MTNLERFMVERLLALDPTLDDSVGSRMRTEVIAPLLKRLGADPIATDIELFLTQRLQDKFPELDISSPGSVLRDLLVSPMAVLLEPLRVEIQHVRRQLSLTDADTLAAEELDALLSTLWVTRKSGDVSYTTVRLTFSSARTVGIDQSIVFSTASGVDFVPDIQRVFAPSELLRVGAVFIVDIPVRSVVPAAAANIGANEIKFVKNLDGVLKVTNIFAARGGMAPETTQEVLASIPRVLTERSFNTKRGIETSLREAFSEVVSVEVVGYGDADMQRDVLQVSSTVETALEGSLLYVTLDFKTLPAAILANENADSAVSHVSFTNFIYIEDTWINFAKRDAVKALIKSASYIRVHDGSDSFNATVLSRKRFIEAVHETTGPAGLIIKLKDFTMYPRPAVDDAYWKPAESTTGLRTDSAYSGFNKWSSRGSAEMLFGTDVATSNVHPIGAPLFFTNALTGADGFPTNATPGVDYLYLATTSGGDTPTTNAVFTGASTTQPKIPNQTKVFPIVAVLPDNIVKIARADAHLTKKAAVSYFGASTFVPPTDLASSMLYEDVEIVAFGGPKAAGAEADSYSGTKASVDTWAKHAGAKLVAASVPGFTTAAKSCTIELEGTMPTWAELAVAEGMHISLALCTTDAGLGPVCLTNADATKNFAARVLWQGVGRIEGVGIRYTGEPNARALKVGGCNWAVLLQAGSGFGDIFGMYGFTGGNEYRLYWTIYKSAQDVVWADGVQAVSHSELVFLPAYKVAANSVRCVSRRMAESYIPGTGFAGTTPCSTNTPLTASYKNHALWLRLDRAFTDDLTAVKAATRLSYINALAVTDVTAGSNPVIAASVYAQYTAALYGIANDVGLLGHAVALPYLEGYGANPGIGINPPTAQVNTANYSNIKQQSGYLLPHPMGAKNSVSPTMMLPGQLLEFYGAPSTSSTQGDITIGGMPGGVPPSGNRGKIISGELHVGNAMDVYVQGAAPAATITGDIIVTQDDLADTDFVVLSGADGSLLEASPSKFFSASLATYFAGIFSGVTSPALIDYVLELVEPPPNVLPAAVQILTLASGGVETVGAITNGNGLTSLRWRLLKQCRVAAFSPKTIVKQGIDLALVANSTTATTASVQDYSHSPTTVSLFLEVLSGVNKGTYQVAEKFANSLRLLTAPDLDSQSTPYRIFTLQPAAVDKPLLRIVNIELAGDLGLDVPYACPVDVTCTSTAAADDDPLTAQELGVGTLTVSGTKMALQLAEDARLEGVLVNDVLHIASLADPYQDFYVTAFENDGKRLVLDRLLPANGASGLDFTLGRPAIAALRLLFQKPTYFEAGPGALFSHTDSAGVLRRYRPSPTEKGVLLQTTQANAGVLTLSAGINKVTFTGSEVLAAGCVIGDYLEVQSLAVQSAAFSAITRLTIATPGKVLVVEVAGKKRSVIFPSTNATTLAATATVFNQQLAGLAYMEEYTPDSGTTYYLRVHSKLKVRFVDEGTTGILSVIKFTAEAEQSNTFYASSLIASFPIVAIVRGSSTVVVTFTPGVTVIPEALATRLASCRIVRHATQIWQPADMVLQESGFWAVDLKATSLAPAPLGTTTADTQFVASGYKSLGYSLHVKNKLCSYSVDEELFIDVTPTVLPAAATSRAEALTTVLAKMVVQYERVPVVADVQSYLLMPSHRNMCASVLARHFLPAYPMLRIDYVGGAAQEDVLFEMQNYIRKLYPNKPMEVFDVLAILTKLNISDVRGPLEVSFLVYDEQRKPSLVRSKNSAALPNKYHVLDDTTYIAISGG